MEIWLDLITNLNKKISKTVLLFIFWLQPGAIIRDGDRNEMPF